MTEHGDRRGQRARCLVAGLAIAAVGACGSENAPWTRDVVLPPITTSVADAGQWSRRTPGGSTLDVRAAHAGFRTGMTTFDIAITPAPAAELPVSVDLASPTMPVHGVTRYRASRSAAGRYQVNVDVPMEGQWIMYVNVADDADTASVTFDAEPAERAGRHAAHHDGGTDE